MNGGRALFKSEQAIIDVMKDEGIFKKINTDRICVGKKESVAVLCSDDHTDITYHHREKITPTVHAVKFFGGPLAFHPNYKNYDANAVNWIIHNIEKGMSLKGNNDLCVYFHFACGMADNYEHGIKEVLRWIPEIKEFIVSLDFMQKKNVHILGHTKKTDEQNSYVIDVAKLSRFINSGGLNNI